MARFLFTCWPFVGHVNPFLCVGKALQARGHEVAFYTGADARPRIEDEGFSVFPFQRIDEARLWNLVTTAESAPAAAGRTPFRLTRVVFQDWLAGTVPAQVADLQVILDAWKPDALACDPVMWGPILVLGETAPCPVAIMSTWLGCPIPGPDAPPWGLGLPSPRETRTRLFARAVGLAGEVIAVGMRRRLDRTRAQYGLPPMGCSVNAFTARLPLYLVPSVPELDFDRRDLPDCVHYVGACVWNKPPEGAAPRWLDELPTDRPWVHVTEGTAHYQDPFVLRAAARGLANKPVEVILTTGPQRDPSEVDLGTRAPNLRLEQWVSHGVLVPRCAALVTTGGAGTVMTALQAGVPLVIVPTRWDKPDNAQRVVEAGAGLRLAPRHCTPEGLRTAVERVLSEPAFRDNARRLARRLAEAPGPAGAAELLESLAAPALASTHAGRG
jgi:UDP:flavonoid glycosyltransferase YjiC (YdhE family)